ALAHAAPFGLIRFSACSTPQHAPPTPAPPAEKLKRQSKVYGFPSTVEPVAHSRVAPAEAEERYYAMLDQPAMAAQLDRTSLRLTRRGLAIGYPATRAHHEALQLSRSAQSFLSVNDQDCQSLSPFPPTPPH
ncbi:hypothetical protein ACCT14_34210, partial [Rhizobium brockwellii]|uniref:hypothetical protein n=1 Tax=Rhizobium brockwellii TaxID=3019932 RepID=UPI003F998F31